MHELCIPAEVWGCVAKYYENPILLLRLAEVCRNSYHGATMDSAWETLIPYECEGSLYRAFIQAALATTKKNRCIIRCCWTGSFPPKSCFPKVPFEAKDYDTAFALAAQKEHVGGCPYMRIVARKGTYRYMCPREYSYLFYRCARSRKFMLTALKFSPWLYDLYYNPSEEYTPRYVRYNAEYCEAAMHLSVRAWSFAKKRFQVWENYDLRKEMLTLYPRAFTDIFGPTCLCSVPEFILGSAPYFNPAKHFVECRDPELILEFVPYYLNSAKAFVECCDPDIFGLELCEELCKIGFPVWIAKPDIEASVLKRFKNFTELPPMFANDREIVESVAKNNCQILEDAMPGFRKDISLVISIFEHNPGVLHYCDASLFSDAEFLRCFQEALKKPNHFFSGTGPERAHQGNRVFPPVLQTKELARIAVESNGKWIHYFPGPQIYLEFMKAAVVTWPLAYSYVREWSIDRDKWNKSLCKTNPRAVWAAGKRFINRNRSIVRKALQLGPLLDGYSEFPYHSERRCFLHVENIQCVLPEILRAHPRNYEILCSRETNRRFILGKKKLVIATLEGTRDSSILWDVPLEILDEDIRAKAREVR